MAQPSTPAPAGGQQPSGPSLYDGTPTHTSGLQHMTPSSTTSSNQTFLMPNSPIRGRRQSMEYRPKITRTVGQRPACLVNASVTYCGNNQLYAFGGFDQYTDEVYNHVLRLDMVSHQWSLVDNYGDIPGVRMGKFGSRFRRGYMSADLGLRPHYHMQLYAEQGAFLLISPVVNG